MSKYIQHQSSNDQSHGIMFHHFHSDKHYFGQGSISADTFSTMLNWISDRFRIVNADEYMHRLLRNTLRENDVCLTFDDALLCQAEIAVPILKERKICAFFFIYSSPFRGVPDLLEIYRYFRATKFVDIDDFYCEFFRLIGSTDEKKYLEAQKKYAIANYLTDYPFYTVNDKWFRYLRDEVLEIDEYHENMHVLMAAHQFDPRTTLGELWMKDSDLKMIEADGHIVGLHSFSHPTSFHKLSKESQRDEYHRNSEHLSEILKAPVIAMSHPCGNYNHETLEILKELGIKIGFSASMMPAPRGSFLEVPRQDHANVLVEMSK